MGTEAIKLITGIGEPLLGRLMVYDALDMTVPHHQDPQGSGHAEDHRAHRLRGVLRRGVRSGRRGRADSTITPRELRELLDSGKPLALIDVREPVEWDINHIEGAS
jgi:adenylyltransferase/sulfurtransferase